jgi:hypothetical protein
MPHKVMGTQASGAVRAKSQAWSVFQWSKTVNLFATHREGWIYPSWMPDWLSGVKKSPEILWENLIEICVKK